MSSLRAKKRRAARTCSAKRRYDDKGAAIRAIEQLAMMNKDTTNMSAYRCRVCKQWHIGHLPGFVRRKIAARRGE